MFFSFSFKVLVSGYWMSCLWFYLFSFENLAFSRKKNNFTKGPVHSELQWSNDVWSGWCPLVLWRLAKLSNVDDWMMWNEEINWFPILTAPVSAHRQTASPQPGTLLMLIITYTKAIFENHRPLQSYLDSNEDRGTCLGIFHNYLWQK